MRKLLLLSALASLLVFAIYDDASARGGGFGGGGFRGGGFGGGGFRGGGFGGGFRGGAIGGYRGAAIGGFRGGYVGRGYWGGGRYLGGARLAYGGRYLGGARLGYGGRYWAGRGYWPYRRYGWGFPLAAGLAFAAASPYYGSYGSSCVEWDDRQWVNVCSYGGYAPYGYSGY